MLSLAVVAGGNGILLVDVQELLAEGLPSHLIRAVGRDIRTGIDLTIDAFGIVLKDLLEDSQVLRVIDNNGDGEVDYVLRTDFVMTTITDYEKRTDVYDVEWNGGLPNGNGEGKIPASAIIKASEDTDLSVGSVILYTLIDGNYYVSNPAHPKS